MKRNLLVLFAIASAGTLHAELVLHYTFDNADLDGRTVLDVAGSADAQAVGAVGLGALGDLGEAAWFPNDDGQSYVTLPAADSPLPNGSEPRTIAFLFNQLAVGNENKMFGYGTGAVGTSFDVSLEGGGIRLRYSGGNVTWGSGFDFSGSDGGFHHVALRVNENAGSFLDVDVLLDGLLLPRSGLQGNPGATPINTGGGAPSELNLGRSPVFAPAGDFIGLLDDFRVYDTALTNAEIAALAGPPETLVVDVDPLTGGVSLRNPTDEPIRVDYYELTSPSGTLDPAGWVDLASQDRPGFAAGSGSGDGWEVLGTPTVHALVEGRLLDDSTIAAGESISLGRAHQVGMPIDAMLTYRSEGQFASGRLGAIAAGAPGDFNGDGRVNAVDYTVWRDALGSSVALLNDPTPGSVTLEDREVWAGAYGAGGSILGAAAPAPATSVLMAAILPLLMLRRPGYKKTL